MTSLETITPEQIASLRDEAYAAGDDAMAQDCEVALDDLADERWCSPPVRRCVSAIRAAEYAWEALVDG